MTKASILDKQGVTHFIDLPAWSPEHSEISIKVQDSCMDVSLIRVTAKGLAMFKEV